MSWSLAAGGPELLVSKCYGNYGKHAHNRYISHYFIIKAVSCIQVQEYRVIMNLGWESLFKKSLWKSIKIERIWKSITIWNQFYFCALLCLGWDVFTVILPFVERILLRPKVSLHNMLFQLPVSLWPFTVFCEDLGKWFSSIFILWLEWMIKLIYRKWNVRLKAHSLLPI